MEAGFMLIVFLAVAIAFALGYLLGSAGKLPDGVQGTVHITRYEPDDACLYLESDVTIDELASMTRAVFNVKTARQNSHK